MCLIEKFIQLTIIESQLDNNSFMTFSLRGSLVLAEFVLRPVYLLYY